MKLGLTIHVVLFNGSKASFSHYKPLSPPGFPLLYYNNRRAWHCPCRSYDALALLHVYGCMHGSCQYCANGPGSFYCVDTSCAIVTRPKGGYYWIRHTEVTACHNHITERHQIQPMTVRFREVSQQILKMVHGCISQHIGVGLSGRCKGFINLVICPLKRAIPKCMQLYATVRQDLYGARSAQYWWPHVKRVKFERSAIWPRRCLRRTPNP